MNIEANINFWLTNGLNVLFTGKHGIGKTAIILDAFDKHNLKYQYFSASTMDPWVDFIGVPKEKIDKDGSSYLDLIRPKHFQDDQVEAIFMDEFNRGSKKVKNAVMELIQFKSINGKKFNNLKVVWAAINPDDDEDEEYDVEKLDPAQRDRFHVQVDLPYLPSAPFFRKKYGNADATSAINWWKELNKDQKNLISPRRLDYALEVYTKGGDIRFVLPKQANVSKLLLELKSGPISQLLKDLIANKDAQKAKEFLAQENNYAASIDKIISTKGYLDFFLPEIPSEKISGLVFKDSKVSGIVFSNYLKYKDIVDNIANTNSKNSTTKKARNTVKLHKAKEQRKNRVSSPTVGARHYNSSIDANYFHSQLDKKYKLFLRNTQERVASYHFLEKNSPNDASKADIDICLTALIHIVGSSQSTTLRRMKKITGIINNFIYLASKHNVTIGIDHMLMDSNIISKLGKGYIYHDTW